jgi:hypothetical protein
MNGVLAVLQQHYPGLCLLVMHGACSYKRVHTYAVAAEWCASMCLISARVLVCRAVAVAAAASNVELHPLRPAHTTPDHIAYA